MNKLHLSPKDESENMPLQQKTKFNLNESNILLFTISIVLLVLCGYIYFNVSLIEKQKITNCPRQTNPRDNIGNNENRKIEYSQLFKYSDYANKQAEKTLSIISTASKNSLIINDGTEEKEVHSFQFPGDTFFYPPVYQIDRLFIVTYIGADHRDLMIFDDLGKVVVESVRENNEEIAKYDLTFSGEIVTNNVIKLYLTSPDGTKGTVELYIYNGKIMPNSISVIPFKAKPQLNISSFKTHRIDEVGITFLFPDTWDMKLYPLSDSGGQTLAIYGAEGHIGITWGGSGYGGGCNKENRETYQILGKQQIVCHTKPESGEYWGLMTYTDDQKSFHVNIKMYQSSELNTQIAQKILNSIHYN